MAINLYLIIANFIKRSKKFKAPAMKKRPHLRANVQRVLTMKPISVNGVPVPLFLKSLLVFYFSVTSRFKLAIVLNPNKGDQNVIKKMIALLQSLRINRSGMMTNKVSFSSKSHTGKIIGIILFLFALLALTFQIIIKIT